MTAADKRVGELLDRWMASLELHTRYLKLDDAAYAQAERWPEHQRPTKWVVDLARQRLIELRAHLTQRKDAGDPTFAESLELMAFLSGLLGAEHLERFIPLATGSGGSTEPKPTVAPQASAVPRQEPAPQPATQAAARAPAGARAPDAAPDANTRQVIADAVRMLEWGREWPAIAGLIARMADRPPEAEVWKILRAHRTAILAKAQRRAD